MNESQVQNEFRPYFKIQGQYMITYDIAVIRMCDIFDSMKSLCLMKKFDGILRMYFNTGTVASVLQSGGYMVTSGTSSTFTNTCPIIQSSLATIPATACGLASGLFIGRATATNMLGGVNLANSNASNPMFACRMYYPQVTLKPEKLIPYISENRAKKIVYTSVLFNTFNSITSGSTYSALVQSGVTNIRGVLLIPFISFLSSVAHAERIYIASSAEAKYFLNWDRKVNSHTSIGTTATVDVQGTGRKAGEDWTWLVRANCKQQTLQTSVMKDGPFETPAKGSITEVILKEICNR